MNKFAGWLIATVLFLPNATLADRGPFDSTRWYEMLDSVRTRAVSENISERTINDTLKYPSFIPSIVRSDSNQSEFKLTLDGYLARKWNQVTDFGALMDPLADKIFVTTIMLILVEYHLIAAWVAAVVICREFMVTGLRLLAVKQGKVISADKFGKLKTVLQMIMLFVGGLVWIHILDLNTVLYKSLKLGHLWHILLWGIVIVTVGSGLNYFIKNRELIADKSQK